MAKTIADRIAVITQRTRDGDLTWRASEPGNTSSFTAEKDNMRLSIRSVDADDGHPYELVIAEKLDPGDVQALLSSSPWNVVARMASGSDQETNDALRELYFECKTREASVSEALDKFLGF